MIICVHGEDPFRREERGLAMRNSFSSARYPVTNTANPGQLIFVFPPWRQLVYTFDFLRAHLLIVFHTPRVPVRVERPAGGLTTLVAAELPRVRSWIFVTSGVLATIRNQPSRTAAGFDLAPSGHGSRLQDRPRANSRALDPKPTKEQSGGVKSSFPPPSRHIQTPPFAGLRELSRSMAFCEHII